MRWMPSLSYLLEAGHIVSSSSDEEEAVGSMRSHSLSSIQWRSRQAT